MSLTGERIFVGFGLGAIQTGLFLYEAQSSGNFGRMIVAEVVPETIRRVREARGYLTVNIAHADHIEAVQVGPVEVLNPAIDEERKSLVEGPIRSPGDRYRSAGGGFLPQHAWAGCIGPYSEGRITAKPAARWPP